MANGTKDWNIMVYLAGDNNLSGEMVWALTEIERTKAPNVNVKARFDPSGAGARTYNFKLTSAQTSGTVVAGAHPSGRSLDKFRDKKDDAEEIAAVKKHFENKIAQLQELQHGETRAVAKDELSTEIGKLQAAVPNIKNLVTEGSANPLAVQYFIESSFDTEKHNLLVLSGHASGAAGEFLQDTNPVSSLSIPRFKEVLDGVLAAKKQEIDILGLDTCVMSMIEVGYEVRNSVKYLVGAEGFEQNIGWPYQKVLEELKGGRLDPKEFSKRIVAAYNAYYRDYEIAGVSTDLAACDLSEFKPGYGLIAAVAKLADELKTALSTPSTKNAILLAHWEAQSYLNDQYVDLYDFCDRLAYHVADEPIKAMSKTIKDILESKTQPVVLKSCYTGPAVQHSHGLSIYFPWSAESKDKELKEYKKLQFARETGWAGFLEKYLDETRRPRRGQPDQTVLHIAPPADSPVVVPSFLPLRNPQTGTCRGLSFSIGTKNPPDGFLRDKCD